jgi:hypothetical protein
MQFITICGHARANIVGDSPMTRSLREMKFPLSIEKASDADDRKALDDADERILSALNES